MLLAIRLPWVSTTSWSPLVLPHFGYFKNLTRFANNSLCKLKSSLRLAIGVFCDQHYPKTRLPSHHLRVGNGCLIEWDGLDHREHPTQGTETKRCVSNGGVSRQRARSETYLWHQNSHCPDTQAGGRFLLPNTT